MLVVTTENFQGYKVTDVKGQVFGVVVPDNKAIKR